MSQRIDITGKKYGHLTVIGLTEKVKGVRMRQWIVSCAACGGEGKFPGSDLHGGLVSSCGCLPRLSLRGFNLVTRMQRTKQKLCKSLSNADPAIPEIRFFLEPSGELVSKDAAEAAIGAEALLALGDGLFSDHSQTWVAP